MIGGGGEAVVFGNSDEQQVIKLLGGDGKAGFGWMMDRDPEGMWVIRPGGLEEALLRFQLMEGNFPTGLELDGVGDDADFLLLRQPFLVGGNPTEAELNAWMRGRGWEPANLPTRLEMLAELSWRRGEVVATDVRPENAILAESDGEIYPFDIIVTRGG
ncbi:hypothetical protein ACFQY0_19045 [Haloferula chungangensis]|uniref:Protein kinase domain-containing protein n=1 Tax=Haloferula chungangensis TaxID=1048331 RepID=A0ABW2LD95_9BACT